MEPLKVMRRRREEVTGSRRVEGSESPRTDALMG